MRRKSIFSQDNWGFQRQLTVLFTGVVILFALLGASVTSWSEGRRDMRILGDENAKIAQNFAQQSRLALLYGIGANATNASETTLGFPDVVGVSIIDKENTLIFEAGEKFPQEKTDAEKNVTGTEYRVLDLKARWLFYVPVYLPVDEASKQNSPFLLEAREPQYLGYVKVVSSKQRLFDMQYESFVYNFITTFLLSSFIWLLLILRTRRLTQPIKTLADLMHKAERGESQVRADASGSLEVKEMSHAFNTMMTVLEQRTQRLDEQNAALVVEIEERQKATDERSRLEKRLQQAQKMEAIGQMTGGIAHDFNNILASILGYTCLAKEKFVTADKPKLGEYLGEINKAGERARDLVLQMLAFSRGAKSATEILDLKSVVQESQKMLASTMPASIEMIYEYATDLKKVVADSVQLHQIVLNLCINARDAMNGKGRLTISARNVVMHETNCASCLAVCDGDYVELSVLDSGVGIPKDVLTRIFDPFYTTKDVGKGSGMGLSMVHGIMHNFGGHILVETELNRGTCFRLLLPVAKQSDVVAPVSAQKKVQAKAFDPTLCRVLVVDDDEAVLQYVEDVFSGRGFIVTSVGDSQKALDIFKAQPESFDLLVTDQRMPGMTGLQMSRAMLEIRASLPVILYSGSAVDISEAELLSAGVKHVLAKPLRPSELIEAGKNAVLAV